MPVWIWFLLVWTLIGLAAAFSQRAEKFFFELTASLGRFQGLAELMIGFPALLVAMVYRMLVIVFGKLLNPIFGGVLFKRVFRPMRIWFQLGMLYDAGEDAYQYDYNLWGIQRHIDRGWGEEVVLCVSEALMTRRFPGWVYCALIFRLGMAAEKTQLSDAARQRMREAVDFTERTKSGKLHSSELPFWAEMARESLEESEK